MTPDPVMALCAFGDTANDATSGTTISNLLIGDVRGFECFDFLKTRLILPDLVMITQINYSIHFTRYLVVTTREVALKTVSIFFDSSDSR